MSESFNVSGNLLFVKDSLIQFVSSGKQNVFSFRILQYVKFAIRLHKTYSRRPQDIFQDVSKTYSRRLQDMFARMSSPFGYS